MTDKFRKQDALIPSLQELLGERTEGEEDQGGPDEGEESSPRQDAPPIREHERGRTVDPPGEPDSAVARPEAEEPAPMAPASKDASGSDDDREAFEPNWYRVLAAQARVRDSDSAEAEEGDEAASSSGSSRNGSGRAGHPGYPAP